MSLNVAIFLTCDLQRNSENPHPMLQPALIAIPNAAHSALSNYYAEPPPIPLALNMNILSHVASDLYLLIAAPQATQGFLLFGVLLL
nr:hypothetical protein [Yersinia enterocolitica]